MTRGLDLGKGYHVRGDGYERTDGELGSRPGKNTGMSNDLSSTKKRTKLSKKTFALPGKRKYPIPDKAHARNALARVAQNGTPAEQKKVKAAVKKRFPSIGKNGKKKA
ncbi:MAG: hypothetical protein JWO57_3715 [Pseudonocardiales bacterium]|nr:hypothetical protein [Pseudonocardiales bacterium]